MYASQRPWVDLYESLLGHCTSAAYTDLLAPWLDQNPDERRRRLDFTARTGG